MGKKKKERMCKQMAETTLRKKKTFLDRVEIIGNKMPHPFTLFLCITGIVIIVSCICSLAGVTAVHPATGEVITVKNYLSVNGFVSLLVNLVPNFRSMSLMFSVLSLSMASGICSKTGFFSAAIKTGLSKSKNGVALVILVAFIGVLANAAGDAAYYFVPPIAALMFYGAGRHPLAGLFCGYAAVGCGFSTDLIPGSFDPLLVPPTVKAAQMLDPDFSMQYLSGQYALWVSSILVIAVITLVTVFIIEPRLGKYTGTPDSSISDINADVTDEERKAVKKAGLSVLIYVVLLFVACIPSNSFLRSSEGSLLFDSPLMDGLLTFILLLFVIPGVVYGISIGKIKHLNDVIKMLEESVSEMAGFVVILFATGQFMSVFSDTNLGTVLAINGGNFIKSLSLGNAVIVVAFIILVSIVNIFIGSGSTKWLLLAPIFVPMLMQLGIHPAFTQFAYRLGDCATNNLSPLTANIIVLFTYCKKYDKNAGMGVILSNMLPYSVFILIVQCIFAALWMLSGLNVGINGPCLMG